MSFVYKFSMSLLGTILITTAHAKAIPAKIFFDYDHSRFELPKDLEQAWEKTLFEFPVSLVSESKNDASESSGMSNKKYAHSCKELYQYYQQGYGQVQAVTDEEINNQDDILTLCQWISLSRTLKSYSKDYLGKITDSKAFFRSLPGINFPKVGEYSLDLDIDTAIRNGSSLGSIARSLGYKISGFSILPFPEEKNGAQASYGGTQISYGIILLAKGDWNGDGIADWVIEDMHAVGNHDTTSGYLVVTRLSSNDYLRTVAGEFSRANQFSIAAAPPLPIDSSLITMDSDLSCAGDHFDTLRKKLSRAKNKVTAFNQVSQNLLQEYMRCITKLASFQSAEIAADLLQSAKILKNKQLCVAVMQLYKQTPYAPDNIIKQIADNSRLCATSTHLKSL